MSIFFSDHSLLQAKKITRKQQARIRLGHRYDYEDKYCGMGKSLVVGKATNWLNVLEKKRYEAFGFVVFRCAAYDDEQRWTRFRDLFEAILRREVASGTSDMQLRKKATFLWVEHEILQDGCEAQVSQ